MPSVTITLTTDRDFTLVSLVGDIKELGAWNPALGLPMKATPSSSPPGRHTYTGVLLLATPPPSQALQFKCVGRESGGGASSPWVWEGGENHTLAIPPSSTLPLDYHVSWCVEDECGLGVIKGDGYLRDFIPALRARQGALATALASIEEQGGLDAFSRGHLYYGFTRGRGASPPGIHFREWAPGALEVSLVGDFNAWDPAATPLTRDAYGVWSTFLPDPSPGVEAIAHDTFVRLSVVIAGGQRVNRLPAYIRYTVRDERLNEYVGKYWNPPPTQRHTWRHPRPFTSAADDYSGMFPFAPSIPSSASDATGSVAAVGVVGVGKSTAPPAPAASKPLSTATATATAAAAAAASAGGTRVTSTGGALPATPPTLSSSSLSHPSPTSSDPAASGLRIYESHVGIAGEEGKVSSYRDFAHNVIPRIKKLGYNCVQLMAIMEHAYYGSFGYHVTSFLAPSSRFGTPEDLKFLVDAAHGAGLLVIMDCIHSHACKNSVDGLNELDGTDFQYFHGGARGRHELWDSRLFDYAKPEVRRLLLSSLRLFTDEFRFDGFRFDGVTSMLYTHHGLGVGFSGGYHEYFGGGVDGDAVTYLQLANTLLHSLSPPALSIAEDVSGAPTLGRPVWEGGVGFDYRLAMAIPDVWIKLLKEKGDEEWDMEALVWTLTNRRHQEKCVTYAESHDQALVGDKTIAFWLMDKEMYWNMSKLQTPRHTVIDRGLSLHKMIRLLTCGLGGEAWLGFMGNEFGHPEWLDFPREGNNWSYHYCRRQWSLTDDPHLLYGCLGAFEGAMHALGAAYPWLLPGTATFVSRKHNGDKVVVFERTLVAPGGGGGAGAGGGAGGASVGGGGGGGGGVGLTLVFIFNFHASASYQGYRIGVPSAGEWGVALDSDWEEFAGYGRVDPKVTLTATPIPHDNRPASLMAYLPARTARVLIRRA